ncbi:hypothetical protein [Streptomyces sp. NPDC089915]|uniref:hypothetical protein n=1 Tax=Streptomyces sp. NPDC089915 TaxID=3155186 RepID=UPI003442BE98
MDEQGGAGGVPLHGDDARRRRGPHTAGDASRRPPEPEPGPVRREDTDEASRLDRVRPPDEKRTRRSGGHG